MFNGMIEWSARNRLVVVVLAVVMLVWGSVHVADTSMDVLPEFSPPQVVIQTGAPGLVAQEVESLVTLPLETAINGTQGITSVRSVSQTGISSITVVFQYGMDPYRARQLITEKLQLVLPSLPNTVKPPAILPIMSAVGDILKIGLVSDTVSPMDLRTIADWTIRNRLLSVPGVARVYTIGGEQKEYQVLVEPERLRAFGVSLDSVRKAAAQANVVAPSGAVVNTDTQLPIQTQSRVRDVDDLAESVIVTRQGTPVLMRHVATIQEGPAFKYGDAIINGKPGVEIVISRQPDCNTIEVTRRVQQALDEVQKGLPKGIQFITIFRQANFIERSLENVVAAIGTGGILVVIVLLLFLANWRTAVISLTAIPLSLMSAILIVKAMGGSINTMTLGGLAIAVGEVVDDAIVDVENVYRRLRENRRSLQPRSSLAVIIDACKEVRSSVTYATFIVALVFLPVFCLTGTEGRIFSPLGWAYVTASLSSLFVALTVTPSLCVYLLRSGKLPAREPALLNVIKNGYSVVLARVIEAPRIVVGCAILMFVAAVCLVPFMGQSFLPEFHEESLIVEAIGLPGQSLSATTRMGMALETELLSHKDILAVGQRAGRAELDDDAGAPNYSEFDLQLRPGTRTLNHIIDDVRRHMRDLPGTTFAIGSFIQHRIEDVLSGGTRAPIVIKIFGPDLPTLRALARATATELQRVPGTVDVRPEPLVTVPEVTIKLNRQRAARYGITADELARNLETAFNGTVVSQVVVDQKLFALKVWLKEGHRNNVDALKELLVDTSSGALVPLAQVADIAIDTAPNAIVRENVNRRIVVQSNVQGRDVVSVVNDAKARIGKMQFPEGYYVVYSGEYAAQQEASQRLFYTGLVVLVGILLLLRQGLGSWRLTLLVAANLPLATIGGIIAVALTGNVLSIGSLIGFISLFGISTRNSLLLVTHISQLQSQSLPRLEAIHEGCLHRVGPVLMTALTAALGMLPLAVWGGTGRELEQPLATVIVGGLISSTILTLLIIPASAALWLPNRKPAPGQLDSLSESSVAPFH